MAPLPKPDHLRRRRNATIAMTKLPAAGRQGKTPGWPLSAPSTRERELWRQLWWTPQAVVWESLGWTHVVARYTRLLTRAEQGYAALDVMPEVRQLEDRLGLTPMAMLRLRWAIEETEAGPGDQEEDDQVLDIRERLAAVDE